MLSDNIIHPLYIRQPLMQLSNHRRTTAPRRQIVQIK